MTTSKRFSLYPATLAYTASTTNLQQLESLRFTPNARRAVIIPAGAVDRAHVGIASADPMLTLGTRDLTMFFGAVSGTTGLRLAVNGASTFSTFRFQERSDAGTFESGSTHETYTIREGFIRPTELSASQDDENGALLTAEVTALWDGTNDPIIRATGVDFSGAPSPAFTSRFFLGPVYHNGSQIDGVVRSSVQFGINFQARRFNGDPYPRLGSIVTREPVLTFTIAKMDEVSALNMFGRSVTSSFVFYYWKGVADATRVAVGTTVHTKISCTAGHIGDDSISVQGNDDGSVDITVLPTSSLSVSVASAIP